MVQPFLLTAGSRGDVEPLLALSAALSRSSVAELTTLCIPSDCTHLIQTNIDRVKVVNFEFSLRKVFEAVPAFDSQRQEHESRSHNPEQECILMGILLRDLLCNTRRIYSMAKASKCSVIVSGFFTFPIAQIIAEKLAIPIILLQFSPAVPSSYYPNLLLNPSGCVAAVRALQQGDFITYRTDKNLGSHFTYIENCFSPCMDALNNERCNVGLSSTTIQDVVNKRSGLNLHVLVAVQSQLMPRAPDMSPNVHVVGSLASSFIPTAWDPEEAQPKLSKFLRSGHPPAVVSYGSMEAQGVAPSLMRALLTGMKQAGVQRVVVVPGKADLGLHHLDKQLDASLLSWAEGRVFVATGNVQFSWLLPKCEMIFCHCGAGTTSVALQAGVPILGTPIIVDQIYFAELIKQMELGDRVGSIGLPSVTAENVYQGIISVRRDVVRKALKGYCHRQSLLGESVENVAKLVERISVDAIRH